MRLLRRLFAGNSLTCVQVEAVMQQYLDSELEPSQVPRVLKHLEACRDCGLEADLYEKIKHSLRAYQQDPDPAMLANLTEYAQRIAMSGPEAVEPR